MRKMILILALLAAPAYAAGPVGALNTKDIGLDQNGTCWKRGPANELHPCGGVTVTATTVLPIAGNWVVVTSAGVASVVVANGTSTQAGAAGTAFFIVTP
jgi:hypothetical protein